MRIKIETTRNNNGKEINEIQLLQSEAHVGNAFGALNEDVNIQTQTHLIWFNKNPTNISSDNFHTLWLILRGTRKTSKEEIYL